MAIIDRFRNIVTVFEVFEVPSSESSSFIKEFSSFIQSDLKGRVGVISYNLHLNEEEGLLLNYAQWKSDADYDLFLKDEELKHKRDLYYSKLVKSTRSKVVFAT